ncbi:MAG: FG-GAP-like repeat-containing protein, partial [Anaerolineae bacterium]
DERDETNNLSHSGTRCEYRPPVGSFDPVLEWSWTNSAVEPSALNAMMTPAVIDLNDDGIPDVVFGSTSRTGGMGIPDGVLRALSGHDGTELFTVTDSTLRINTSASVAVGDIDLDGRPEIVVSDSTATRLIAFEQDGTFKWRSPNLERIPRGGASIADMDGDGTPEIVIGRQVLNNDGSIRWTGTGGRGSTAPLSLVADIDMDGRPEVVAGNTAYRSDGSVYWHKSDLPDGFNAVANFDDDPFPEIVLVRGSVRLLEHDGTVKWGPVSIPGAPGPGGPPTVADYDSDGQVEIGIASRTRYAVFETDGSLKWATVIQDVSSGYTGSSVFDFEGDGSAEVVYRDELKLRVYRGADGVVLFETPMSSCTWNEYVLVADVDADGNAEIVAVANNNCGYGPQRGVFVFGDANDTWVPTRQIWNQHTYHITNINDDGTIPAVEENNWETFNNYRQNATIDVLRAPDLTASRLLFDAAGLPDALRITARIGNGGALQVGAGLPVAFYDGDPVFGGTLISTAFTSQPLEPAEYEDVTITWTSPPPGAYDIYVVADDDGTGSSTQNECDETNNSHHQPVDTNVIGPDLVIPAMDRSGTTTDPQALTIVGDVAVQLKNQGNQDVTDPFQVTLFEDTDGDAAFTDGADNVLGQRTYFGSLAIDQSIWLSVAVSGNVLFRDNLIYAYADSQDVIAELDEDNNLNQTGAFCQYLPPESQFQPELEWEWAGSSTLPSSNQVMMTPAVIDLTADGIPDVVFTTFGTNWRINGHLRAISGNDGSEIFTVSDPNYDVCAGGSIAVGDTDLDGRPEILAVDESRKRIIAFEHDGTFKWRSPNIGRIDVGGAAVADIDQDGTPEIVVEATVLNNDGTVRWTGAYGRGSPDGIGPLSLVANLDLAGDPEVVAGNTAYRSDGSLYWHDSSLTDGYNAVADFDDDPFPEVVLVTQQKVYLLEHDGTVKWGPAFLPGSSVSNVGGPPTIADVDGDGEPEIGVAGGYAYAVFETDGTLKWSSPTQDLSSNVTGSSVFDFEGDGSAEVIYSDELKLRIYRGIDGTILWETPSPSATIYELPVIVDVDADGNAEIVMGSNNYRFPGITGIQVYGDAFDTWVPTRQIWNQHTYHITNVNDDGTIPQVETNNWQVSYGNNYRLNTQTRRDVPFFAAPDLTASYIRVDVGSFPTSVGFTVRIGNGGATVAAAGLPVAFYDGDPAAGATLLGIVQTTQNLDPGEFEDVTFTWTTPGLGLQTVYVVADDDGTGQGTANECDETNNIHWRQYITGPEGPDLVIPLVDAGGTSTDPRTLAIQGMATAQIENQGSTAVFSQYSGETRLPKSRRLRKSPESAGAFDVTFFEDVDRNSAYTPGTDNVLGQTTHAGGLNPGATISVTAAISGQVQFLGSPLWAFADSGEVIAELDETNNLNQTATQCQVNAAPAPDLTLSHLRGEPAGSVDLTVRVGNGGAAPVGPGIGVNFYLGDPVAGGALLGSTATSRTLAPGEYQDVTVRWTNETTGSHTIYVTVGAAGECDEANNSYQQIVDILDIPLAESCNLISGWVNPFTTDIGVVQRPISGTYVVIQGFDQGALVHYPDLPPAVNTLKDMDAEHGYWVKTVSSNQLSVNSNQLSVNSDQLSVNSNQLSVISDQSSQTTDHRSLITDNWSLITDHWSAVATLRLVGTAFPENRPLELDAGWNLVSFLSRNEMGVIEGLRSIDGEYTAVLGFEQGALSYYPHLEPHFNTLWALQPLHGYWLKMTQESTLRYPRTQPDTAGVAELAGADPDARRRALLARQAELATGVQTTNTWVNFYGPARLADGKPAPEGALVQVFDADGVPCGAGIVTEPGLYGLLACYGDDPTTPADKGARPGDTVRLTVDGQELGTAVWTAHGDLQWVPLGPAPVWRVWMPMISR